jgi:glycosyltransferase involved in cell wall biosynthesis|tara:strand:+ start:136 stop:2028 length:1893 start_codon:yes stop_codon:yes gene_type:complete
MSKKKTVLIHSNFCRAYTGFGKNKKNILRYLYETGKYNIVELANGVGWEDPATKLLPWECRGSMPPPNEMQGLNPEQQRAEGYGLKLVDKAIKEFKPDVYIGMEDIWAFNTFHTKPWWNKINTMIWTTLDSLPILPQAIEYAPKIKHYYVWASFAEKAMKEMGYYNVKTLRGSLDTNKFFRLSDKKRKAIREKFNLSDEYIVGFVFRNQLRKSVPNILEGFKIFKQKNPKAKLLLHTHWSEGWDIPRLMKEKQINPEDVLTTYVCNKCGIYHISPFKGQEHTCVSCGSQRSVNTTNTGRGVTDAQLNEIYNLMDVYCHPFTSGGQEIPIQEAKLTELITLVTNYSCGEDSCSPESGGLPLEWSEYREPGTQFIKASTFADDIAKKLELVQSMDKEERVAREKKSRQWVIDNFSVEVIGKQLEDIIDNMPPVDYDFESKGLDYNPDYEPKENYVSHQEFLIDIYKNILCDDVDENSQGFKHWMTQLQAGKTPVDIVNYFKNVAIQEKQKIELPDLEQLLSKESGSKKIAIVIPYSDVDVFLINALLKNLKSQYKKHNLYIFTQPQFYPFIDDNPAVHKLLPYSPIIENQLTMEGVSDHEGFFEMVFYPHTTTQKSISYLHNGVNKHQFSLR